MMVKVGLLTSSGSSAKPSREPAHEGGLAGAEFAEQQQQVARGQPRRDLRGQGSRCPRRAGS